MPEALVFKPVKGYWFTFFTIDELKRSSGCIETTLDLGLSTRVVCVENNRLLLSEGIEVDVRELEPSEHDRVVLLEETGRIYEVVLHTETGFYKLKATGKTTVPTLEINGIHMHRIQDTDPWRDTISKIRAARVTSGLNILDTCMGLGYTAIASLRRGASNIYTFEIDENVVWIAERNPWSRELSSDRIRINIMDVVEGVFSLESEHFHRVIHDPPRFTRSTGNLYSLDFYKELYRVLRHGGILFHYTGEPRRHGAPSILKGIKNRLMEAGFTNVYYDAEAQGFIGFKK